MYACYLLTGVSFCLILFTGIQGYFSIELIGANHPTFALLTAIFYLFTETLIIFFFVGTGVNIRDYSAKENLTPEFHRQSIDIKRKIYPPTLLNIFLVMTLFIVGGGVHTGVIPTWTHGILFWLSIGHFAHTSKIQHHCFKANTEIFIEFAKIDHRSTKLVATDSSNSLDATHV